jgi:release factor glutamine methyltransferase
LPEPVNLIVANLPYIKETELPTLPPEISMFEPQIALAGGIDGLKQIERLLSQASSKLLTGGAVLLEIAYEQGQTVSELAKHYIPDARVNVITDLAGLDRLTEIFST